MSSERARTEPQTVEDGALDAAAGPQRGETMAETAETAVSGDAEATTAAQTRAGEAEATETDAGTTARPAKKRAPAKTAAAAAAPSTRAPRARTTTAKPRTRKTAQARTAETTAPAAPAPPVDTRPTVLTIDGLRKRYGDTVAVDGVTLDIKEGSFYGIVGPNGAGKTTTLSIVTGLLRPDAGRVVVHGVDVWAEPVRAKHIVGVLPDKLRLFDRLSGAQFLRYAGTLRGLSAKTVRARTDDLAAAFGIDDALDRLVADYSAGMTKKIALAAAMIHSPRLLVLDEPFESVDPVSAANIIDILQRYTAAGGTVVVSSHGMDMIQRVCDSVAIIVRGQVLAAGTIDEVRGEQTLEERFVDLAGGRKAAEGMEWLHSFSE
ncbi:ABC transporter ATP-binding protein [Leifsonia virtsii]|uniref:ABC transporter ATP-binding protein n=1 Tax=Leifsonia virtsii TaxID=3035915 RepID=UPI003F4DFFF0